MNAPNLPSKEPSNPQEFSSRFGIRHPLWLLISTIVPQVFLWFLFFYHYKLIQSLLKTEHLDSWARLSIAAGIMLALALGTTLHSWRQKTSLPIQLAPLFLVGNIGLLYFYFYSLHTLFPSSIPRWMLNVEELTLLPLGLLMPAIFYALLLIIDHFTPNKKGTPGWPNLFYALSVPLGWYLFSQALIPLIRKIDHIGRHLLPILFILTSLVFFFFLLRGLFLIIYRRSHHVALLPLLYVLVAIIFPILGLAIYNNILLTRSWHTPQIVGDLSHPLFFIAAVLGGVFLLIPNPTPPLHRLGLYALRMVFYTYTFYFFVIFLPFIPLSIVVILLAGLGFLILAPTLLMGLHTYILIQDIQTLQQTYRKTTLAFVSVFAFSIIPGAMILSMYQERATLHHALTYLYQPKGPELTAKRIRLSHLRNSAQALRKHLRRSRRNFLFQNEKSVPFLTSLYQNIVLDNMTLSNKKLEELEQIFLHKNIPSMAFTLSRKTKIETMRPTTNPTTLSTQLATPVRWPVHPPQRIEPYISSVDTATRYNLQTKRYQTTITLMIQNDGGRQQEFSTSFRLPAGVWVKDYALWMDGKKIHGALTEKKSTLWIYQQIVNARRDPGLLYYESAHTLRLRVFPVPSKGSRKTSFTFLHRSPFLLQLAQKTYPLGSQKQDENMTRLWKDHLLFFPRKQKAKLPKLTRQPYLHVVLDYSKNQTSYGDRYAEQIEYLQKRYGFKSQHTQITLGNYQARTIRWDQHTVQRLRTEPCQGGFFLERILKSIYLKHARKPQKMYPLVVVLSPNIQNAILRQRLHGISFLSPDQDFFYSLSPKGELAQHSLHGKVVDKVIGMLSNKRAPFFKTKPVHAWPSKEQPRIFLSEKKQDSIVLLFPPTSEKIPTDLPKEPWKAGLALHGLWLLGQLHLGGQENWLTQIRWSWRSHILSPQTSFTVLENQAQWEALRRKQKQVLAGKSFFDLTGDAPRRMDEPPLWLLMLLFGLFFFFSSARKKALSKH